MLIPTLLIVKHNDHDIKFYLPIKLMYVAMPKGIRPTVS